MHFLVFIMYKKTYCNKDLHQNDNLRYIIFVGHLGRHLGFRKMPNEASILSD